MRERSNRAVSKTVELKGSGGSNPPLSAMRFWGSKESFFLWVFDRKKPWRDVRVVYGTILERLRTERYRGFESRSLR